MKIYLLLFPFIFTGCCGLWCEPEVVIKTEYIYQQIPPIPTKPKNPEVKFQLIKFNDVEMFALSKSDAFQLGQNWIDYSSWAEENYFILKTLESDTTKDVK